MMLFDLLYISINYVKVEFNFLNIFCETKGKTSTKLKKTSDPEKFLGDPYVGNHCSRVSDEKLWEEKSFT